MPKLIIDGRETDAPKGTPVIEAAARIGIIIPRFCYHPALGPAGACRMCAVKFVDGPVKGVQMSCMVDVADGMVVSTTDKEAADFRRHVVEWLMLNHPHDCPVCDEGGHCLLQDMTVAGGHGFRRYRGLKRTYRDQFLGSLVQHEMNRCIHCWRCRRFYQEFAGYRDLGAMQIGHHTTFGRQSDGPLESPFSGNLIDICPTGVYTDKPARFRGRRWDFERAPSLCPHCSLGCRTVASARYREVVRIEGRVSPAVNGWFLCDRGRFGHGFASHPDRPRQAFVRGRQVPVDEALRTAADELARIAGANGPGAIACLGSDRSGLETQGTLKRLSRAAGWPDPVYFARDSLGRKVRFAVARLDGSLAVSMAEIEEADFIVAAGADPVNEAPMLALALRQARRRGATVVVIDPRPVVLPFEFEHLAVPPGEIERCMALLVRQALPPEAAAGLGPEAHRFYDALPTDLPGFPAIRDRIPFLAATISSAKRPVVVCGTDVVPETVPETAADLAFLLRTAASPGREVGLFYLLPGANAFGAGLLSSEAHSFSDIVEGIEAGRIRALLAVETDPFRSFPDRARLEKALASLSCLTVLDYLPTELTGLARIFLPTLTHFETPSRFINQEGRLALVPAVCRAGIPIDQLTRGAHPPRLFRADIPGGGARGASEILETLTGFFRQGRQVRTESSDETLFQWLAGDVPSLAGLSDDDPSPDGRRIPCREGGQAFGGRMAPVRPETPSDGSLELLTVEWTFGTEELSAYSRHLDQVGPSPSLTLQATDALRLGFKDGDRVTVDLGGARFEIGLSVREGMARGVAILPRHRGLGWENLGAVPERLSPDRICRIPEDPKEKGASWPAG